jgi:heterodisulfide reductase subunit C2
MTVEPQTSSGVKDLHKMFLKDVFSTPGGEKIKQCQQCGTCSGSCPTSYLMDYTPREIIAAFRAGQLDKVLKSNTIWLCTSCYSCTVRCPAGIKVTDMMYELKRLAIKYDLFPKEAKNPTLTRIFVDNLHKYGVNHEAGLIMKYSLHSPSLPFKFAGLGMKLFAAGRMPLFATSIQGRDEIEKITRVLAEKEVAP